jgi:type IV pilus assembly protein PilQ
MSGTKALLQLLTICAAGTLLNATTTTTEATAAVSQPRITAISSRGTLKGTSLVIEASEPVSYVATRPDPMTVLVDLRNAVADNAVTAAAKARGPIAAVSVEPAESAGAPTSRIRISLTSPVAHRVRSVRSFVIVDFDKSPNAAASGLLASATPQALTAAPEAHVSAASNDGILADVTPAQSAPVGPSAMPVQERPVSAVDPIEALGLNTPRAAQDAAAAPPRPAPATQPPATPPAQPPSPATFGTGQPNERRYSGHPVSLDFQGADLRAVLRTFAEISGLNIVIDPKVNGTVDVALKDVPWDQALDQILRANSLGYVVDGTIVRVAPLDALEAEQKKITDLAKAQAEAGQIATLTRQLSYAKGEDIVAMLKSAGVLSQRGTAYVDPRTNTLIITDLSDRLQSSTQLINTLDTPQPQVEIEARIVQTNKDYARALGVQWGFNGRVDPTLGNTTPLAFPNNGSLGGRVGGTQGPVAGGSQQPTAVNLGVPGAANAVGLALGSINGAFNLDVALTALERSGNGRLLSTPRVTTQNNIPAEVTQGVQIPIQVVANNTVTVQFRDAALTLRVTPQITAANTVIMQIAVENASPDFSRAINNIPPINTQRANTQVLVSDGQTTVIGGIYVSQEQVSSDRTPGLSRVPLLGWLFKRDTLNDQSTELLIFITPRIIKT